MMNPTQLLNFLLTTFDEAALKELCRQLAVTYDELPNSDRHEKALALFEHMQKQGRLPELATQMSQMRPRLATGGDETDRLRWIDEIATGLGKANPPQTTSQIAKLKDIHEPDKPGPVTNAPALRRDPAPEMPTTSWNTAGISQEAAHLSPNPNPYYAGRLVTDKAMFFGREEERQWLRTRLQNLGSSAIVGMRRSGKSSLLYYLCHHEFFGGNRPPLFAYLDLQDARYQTLPGLLNGALSQWAAALGQENIPQVTELAAFSTAVQRLVEHEHPLILCLDGFEQLTKRPEQFGDSLLESWHTLGSNGHLTFVTTSRHPLAHLCKQSGLTSNFDSIFAQLELGLLDETSALALVREPAQRQGINLPASAVDELLLLGGAHPFYLQMAAHHLVDLLQLGGYHPAKLKQDFLHEAQPYWQQLWAELVPLQQKLLAEVMQPDPPLVIKRQYRQLAQWGVLREEAGAYRPFSDAFGAWLDAELHANTVPTREAAALKEETWWGKLRGLWGH